MHVYEAKKDLCKVCNTKDVVFYPVCINPDDNSTFWYGVCAECRDKVPYEVIPVKTTMDEGYFFCPYPSLQSNPIITKYGKKLLENE